MMPPLVERELRVALLRRNAREQWLKAAWIAGGISLFFLFIMVVARHRPAGRTLFLFLFAIACVGVIKRGFGLTADLFSEERRNGTLGLLVLTGLRPLEIFFHKLAGAVVLCAYGLLGAMPFFAISFLAGGVSATQFVCALVFLGNALFFCVALGLLGSVLSREAGTAQVTALLIGATLSLAAPLMLWTSRLYWVTPLNPSWLGSSPAYLGYLVAGGFTRGSPRLFWIGSIVTVAYSATALVLAAVILQRTWREEPASLAPKKWREWWQNLSLGSVASRQQLRARLLATNAFCWLAARDRRPVLVGKLFTGTVAAFWLVGWATIGRDWLSPGTGLIAALVLHQGLNWVVSYAAAKRFGEERQSGGFELLLTTPLTPTDLIEGQNRSLIVQFKGLFLGVLLLDGIFAFSSFVKGQWDAWLAGMYLAMWIALIVLWFAIHLHAACRAMWISLWTGRPGYAGTYAMKPNVWLLVWVFWCRGAFARSDLNSSATFALVALFLVLIASAVFQSRRQLREKLCTELPYIVRAPIPARGDKRFKRWNPKAIYPPTPWGTSVTIEHPRRPYWISLLRPE